MDRKPFIFDLETGGFDSQGERASSILSTSYTGASGIVTNYSRPTRGSWVSNFSTQNILPQLLGKSTVSERDNIHSFIQGLNTSRGPVVGYNSVGFDIPFMKGRAAAHNLLPDLQAALRGRQHVDVSWGVKDIISSSIASHADRGTFTEILGKDWAGSRSQFRTLGGPGMSPEFNMISQAIGYRNARLEGKPAMDIKMAGWKLEDVHSLLRKARGTDLVGSAHESAVDVQMTQDLMEASDSGELKQAFSRPDIAHEWVKQTVGRREETLARGPRGAGAFFQKGRTFSEVARDLTQGQRLGVGVGLTLAAIAGGIAATRLFADDDRHNTIEGLMHGGSAQYMRKAMTDFGSGWDPVRALLKAGEKLDDVLRSPEFQKSLEGATEIGRIGEASKMASVTQMKGSFRGQEFSFARKRGLIGEQEGATMRQFQDDFAPSLYGERATPDGRVLDMELFKGTELRGPLHSGNVSTNTMDEVANNLNKMHAQGVIHGDLHSGNVMLTPEGKVGFIDFGGSGKVGDAHRIWGKDNFAVQDEMEALRSQIGKIPDEQVKEGLARLGPKMYFPGNELKRVGMNGTTTKQIETDSAAMRDLWTFHENAAIKTAIRPTGPVTGAPAAIGSKTGDVFAPPGALGAADDLFGASSNIAPARDFGAADDLFDKSGGLLGEASSAITPARDSSRKLIQAKMQQDATSNLFDMASNGGKLSSK